ncbi:hypothetical protein Sste5346_005897 [Sporothrix stenoceras]|uniref:non-specific serine/threonine protein kinase n=1 Tax=Sporothrix stenoceras TaxID=5173 RepID=A0ABR3Z280_9PEZI
MVRRRRQAGKAPKKPRFNIPYCDKGKPDSPFRIDARFSIQQHEAPAPFGNGYKVKDRRGEEVLAQMRKEQLPQSIYCMHNQPPGPEPAEDAPRVEIEITEHLRNLLTTGAHLVACRILKGTVPTSAPPVSSSSSSTTATACPPPRPIPPTHVVAKIFDPMYYHHSGTYDIVDMADMEYCRETAAYQHLVREGVDGQLLPAYYGSYSLELPLDQAQKDYLAEIKGADHPLLQVPNPVRRVRIILMGRVHGLPMTTQLVFGDVNAMSNEARLDVVATTLEAYARLYFHGITHGDLAPRNVFLKDINEDSADSTRIRSVTEDKLRFHRFVDLGLAYVLGRPESAFSRQSPDEMRPRNPIRLFWHVFESGAVNMYYWLPKNMRCTEVFQLWMLQRWYGDTRFESVGAVPIPVKNDLAWERSEAITNETWPETKGEDFLRTDDDEDDDSNGRRGWQIRSALTRAMAAIPGIRAISVVIKQQKCAVLDDKTIAAVRDASYPAAFKVERRCVAAPVPACKPTKDRPRGFW